jgi:hypothetical protein
MNAPLIKPTEITNFNRDDADLQAFWIFGCIVAGKNSEFASNVVSKLLHKTDGLTPFEWFRSIGETSIRNALVASKSGNYTRITRFIMESLDLDLRTATQDELMKVHGIGPKTASFFLLHTRPDVEVAVLDVHILKYLRSKGIDAPHQTPSNLKLYKQLQNQFIYLAKLDYPFMSLAHIDLHIWMKYSNRLDELPASEMFATTFP